MLADLIEKFKVVNSVGEEIGKIKDIYIDINTWKIAAFEISPGALKKNIMIRSRDISKFDESSKHILLKDGYETSEASKQVLKEMYPFNELKKHHVVDSDGEKIGKIYNLEIPIEKLRQYKVWKILVKTGFKERRIRISPKEIKEIMDDIRLAKTIEHYQESDQ
ncbi:MAG: PRC-barrel domain-containing protein [Thermoplasmatota archaeon]